MKISNKFYKIFYLLDSSFAIVDSVVVDANVDVVVDLHPHHTTVDVVVVDVDVVSCSFSKRCIMARRFSVLDFIASFKFVRNADKDSPFTFVGVRIAVVVAQINATNNREVFILMVTKAVKKQPECNFFQTKVIQYRIRFGIIFYAYCTVLAQKFKPINVISTPFSVNAQLHLCLSLIIQNDFRSISNSPKDDARIIS